MSQLFSKEPLGSKENPVFISDINEISEAAKKSSFIKRETWIKYICIECGKETVRHLDYTDICMCKKCKSIQTNLKRYGIENPFQLQKVIEGTKNRDWTERNEKTRKTCIEKFGVDCPFKSKEVQQKIKETNLKNLGVENPFASEEIKSKLKEKWISTYGVDNPSKSKNVVDKIKNTLKERYGVEHALQYKEFLDKSKETSIKRFGVSNYGLTDEHTEKMKATNLKKFGTEHAPNYKYCKDGLLFDSSWELAFYIYYVDRSIEVLREPVSFKYFKNGKEHLYFPDFIVEGKIFEIKGRQFLTENNELRNPFTKEVLLEKTKCMQDNSVILIDDKLIKPYLSYIKEKYGAGYLGKFKISK